MRSMYLVCEGAAWSSMFCIHILLYCMHVIYSFLSQPAPFRTIKEADFEADAEKTKRILISYRPNAGQNHSHR
jgi:hypothetical protein